MRRGGRTFWIPVATTASSTTHIEFINGAETFLFGKPFVLTTFSPGSDLLLWPLLTSFFNHTVPNDQLWGVRFGALP